MQIRRATKHLSLLTATAVLSAGVAVLGGNVVSAGAAVAATGLTPNDGSRAAVAAAYQSQWAPTTGVTVSPTGGSNSSCTPWASSSTIQSSTLQAINFARWMTGAEPVTFDQTLSDKAARAAQMMVVNNTLSHAPPSSWTCYSADGAEAAGKSNLSSWGGASQSAGNLIDRYLTDSGSGNVAAGHRRWILYPKTRAMGSGNARAASNANGANALWVVGNARTDTISPPTYSGWPTAGYFPRQLEPNGRWSFSTSRGDTSLSAAKVSVRNAAGSNLALTQHAQSAGYALNTIVWDFATTPAIGSGSEELSYVVTVSGIKVSGVTQSPYSYTVRLFDPTTVTATPNQLSTSTKATVSTSGKANVTVSCTKACEGWGQLRSDEAGTQRSSNAFHYYLAGAGSQTMAFTGVPNISADWLTRINPVDSGVVFNPVQLVKTEAPQNTLKTSASTKVSTSGRATVYVSCTMACEGWAQPRSDEAGTQRSSNAVHYKLSKAGYTAMYFTGVPNISADWLTRINPVDSAVVFNPLRLAKTEAPQNTLKTSASTKVSTSGRATVYVSCTMACEGWAQVRSDEAGTQRSSNAVHYKLSKAGYTAMYFTGVPYLNSTTWKTRINASAPASSSGVTFNNLRLIKG